MIKLKQSFGNVKCKVDSEYAISKYEISILENQKMNGLLSIQEEKNGEIVYVGNTKKSLAQLSQQGLNRFALLNVLRLVSDVVCNVKKMGLNEQKLILNPEWIYISENCDDVQILYCPVNGVFLNFDFALFARDLLIAAKVNPDTRNEVEKWIRDVQISGVSARKVEEIAFLCEKKEKLSKPMQEFAFTQLVDDEAPTGLDDEDEINFENSFEIRDVVHSVPSMGMLNVDDEAPTGLDDEEESPTGVGDDYYIRDMMDTADGTMETTSESGYYSNRPTLYRKSTGEVIKVSKDEFKIGRSQQRADFCITDNNSVSNIHATIFTHDGTTYYIKDNRSTNGTKVNGVKVDPNGGAVILNDGAKINLFNEELEFRF